MAGSDHWLWHPAAGKPWMVEKRILRHDGPAAATQIGAEEALTAAPLEPPDLPRVLLRLYCTVDAEQDAETMDEREYALFCVDHAEVLKTYAYKLCVSFVTTSTTGSAVPCAGGCARQRS